MKASERIKAIVNEAADQMTEVKTSDDTRLHKVIGATGLMQTSAILRGMAILAELIEDQHANRSRP